MRSSPGGGPVRGGIAPWGGGGPWSEIGGGAPGGPPCGGGPLSGGGGPGGWTGGGPGGPPMRIGGGGKSGTAKHFLDSPLIDALGNHSPGRISFFFCGVVDETVSPLYYNEDASSASLPVPDLCSHMQGNIDRLVIVCTCSHRRQDDPLALSCTTNKIMHSYGLS